MPTYSAIPRSPQHPYFDHLIDRNRIIWRCTLHLSLSGLALKQRGLDVSFADRLTALPYGVPQLTALHGVFMTVGLVSRLPYLFPVTLYLHIMDVLGETTFFLASPSSTDSCALRPITGWSAYSLVSCITPLSSSQTASCQGSNLNHSTATCEGLHYV